MILSNFPGNGVPKFLALANGDLVPLVKADTEIPTPTAHAPQIAAGYSAFTDEGLVEGSGKVVKKLVYGYTLARYQAENGRYYVELQDIDVSKISDISAVANSVDADGKAGLTITVKGSEDLSYSVVSLSVDDTAPIQTDHTIENGVLRLEAFGKQYSKIIYSILEEN